MGGSSKTYGNRTRYSAGKPNARSQSLANRMDPESSAHAGDKLLQFPPVNNISRPSALRSQTCSGPFRADVNAVHFPSGETTGFLKSSGTGAICAVTFLVEGSNCIKVDFRFATNSK